MDGHCGKEKDDQGYGEHERHRQNDVSYADGRPIDSRNEWGQDPTAHLGKLQKGRHYGTELQSEERADADSTADDEDLLQADQPDDLA